MPSVQGVQANKMPFFQKMCPQKTHPCSQCLEQALTVLSAKNDKRIQSIDSIEMHMEQAHTQYVKEKNVTL